MNVLFSFTYDLNLTEEESNLLTPLIRQAGSAGTPTPLPFVTAERPHPYYHHEYSGNLKDIAKVAPRVLRYIKLLEVDTAMTIWQHITEKLSEIEAKIGGVGDSSRAFNERVNVHVPGLGLLLINEALVEHDACTERLNDMLQQGWRILAVCPQPDQRRPDYVMGRSTRNE